MELILIGIAMFAAGFVVGRARAKIASGDPNYKPEPKNPPDAKP